MAMDIWVQRCDDGQLCDKCKKVGSAHNPIVVLQVRSREAEARQFIQVHKNCLLRAIGREEKAVR